VVNSAENKTTENSKNNSQFPPSVKPILAGHVQLQLDNKDWVF
jgi:hypothetical protein